MGLLLNQGCRKGCGQGKPQDLKVNMRNGTTITGYWRKAVLAGCMIAAVAPTSVVLAQPVTGGDIPTPLARPFAPTATRESPINLVTPQARPLSPDRMPTSAIGRVEQPTGIGGALKSGLDALSGKDVARALTLRNAMPAGLLDRDILSWAIALSGRDGVPSTEIANAERELQNWPGLTALRRNFERAIYKENPAPAAVLAEFGGSQPRTTEGMLILSRAYVASGNSAKARLLLAPWWRTTKLSDKEERDVLREFSGLLTREDHFERLIRALYANRMASAALVAGPANARSLYEAFLAISRKTPDTAQKLGAVDRSLQANPAYSFAKIRFLRRADRFDEAAELMLKAPRDARSLVDPDAWWGERRVLSRELLDAGKPQLAYRVAAAHAAESPTMAAEAEFHAGWYALRALKDPGTASRHFTRIAEISSGPISASRAYYWLGRAADAGAAGDANGFYRRSAHFGTTFYGQLAAAKLGMSTLELPYPRPNDADRARFADRKAVQAIRRLEAIGYASRADVLYVNLAQELSSVGELALLAVMAERNSNHYLALRVGKIAATRGLDVGALSHPIGAIPGNADIKGSGMALAYAIARQESEFNVSAVSSAGARGLLQLMPTTAKAVAARAGMAFSQPKLTTDAAYNATLGAHFLGEQLDRFNGSYVLTFSGYNAGPARANEWIQKYGDPRGMPIEQVVDWIEGIPYHETRNYVQRVMENYEVYKARLTGKADIQRDLIHGRN